MYWKQNNRKLYSEEDRNTDWTNEKSKKVKVKIEMHPNLLNRRRYRSGHSALELLEPFVS